MVKLAADARPRAPVFLGASLAIGAVAAHLGLVIVLPVLGHGTWHRYRRAVAPPPG
jgi:uncharacterized membrane protein